MLNYKNASKYLCKFVFIISYFQTPCWIPIKENPGVFIRFTRDLKWWFYWTFFSVRISHYTGETPILLHYEYDCTCGSEFLPDGHCVCFTCRFWGESRVFFDRVPGNSGHVNHDPGPNAIYSTICLYTV